MWENIYPFDFLSFIPLLLHKRFVFRPHVSLHMCARDSDGFTQTHLPKKDKKNICDAAEHLSQSRRLLPWLELFPHTKLTIHHSPKADFLPQNSLAQSIYLCTHSFSSSSPPPFCEADHIPTHTPTKTTTNPDRTDVMPLAFVVNSVSMLAQHTTFGRIGMVGDNVQ